MNFIPKNHYIYLCVFILFCASTIEKGMAAPLVFGDDFEQGKVGQPPVRQSSTNQATGSWGNCSGNCAEVTSEKSRNGGRSLKSYLSRSKSRINYRTEAVPRNEIARNTKMGEHYWYGFSIFIPNHHIPDSNSQDIVFQLHALSSGNRGGPPISLIVDNKNWVIPVRWNTDKLGTKDSSGFGRRAFTAGSYNTGVWTDWVYHVKWSYKNDGIVEVWKDGKKVVSYNGPNAYNDGNAPHPTLGIYKPKWRNNNGAKTSITDRTFYHDEIRIVKGADGRFSDVDPAQNLGSSPNKIAPPEKIKIISKN